MKKPSYYVREVERVWKEDGYDLRWFITTKDWDTMSDKEINAYLKGAKAMLRCVKQCVDDII